MGIRGILLTLTLLAGTAWAQRPELVPQTGHGATIDEAIFSPDGKLLATSGSYMVKLWSPATGRLLRTLRVDTLASAMAFSPDGKYLVVGEGMGAEVETAPVDSPLRKAGDAYQVQFWDVNTGELVRKVRGHAFWISSIAFSPDGKWLATAGSEGEILLREGASGRVLAQLRGKVESEKAVWPQVTFSPDGSLLAFSDGQDDVEVWDVARRARLRDLGPGTRGAAGLRFTSNGKSLVGVIAAAEKGKGGDLVLWELDTGKQDLLVPGIHGSVAISHDWSLLAVGTEAGDEKRIEFYDLTKGTKLGAAIPGYGILEFSPDDAMLVSWNPYVETKQVEGLGGGGGSPEIIVWDLKKTLLPLQRIPRFSLEDRATEVVAYSVAVGDGGRLLARRIAGMTGGDTLALWDLTSNSGPRLLRAPQGVTANIALSQRGRWVALSVPGGVLTAGLDKGEPKLLKLPEHDSSAWTDILALSPDEQLLARTGMDGKIKPLTIWQIASGNVTVSLTDVVGFAWFPDSHQFVTGDKEGNIQVRASETGQVVRKLGVHAKVNAVAVSPDGRRVASGADDGTVRIWDAGTGAQVAAFAEPGCAYAPSETAKKSTVTIKVMPDCVAALQYSPDGRLLVAAGQAAAASIFVWDAATGKLLHSLTNSFDATGSADSKFPFAFTADSRFLIQGTRYITLWDLKSGQPAAILATASGGDWLVISPDGYFDGSPGGWKGIAWRFGGSTFDVVPVEAFYGDFYEPGLLSAIVAGNAPRAKQGLEERDRRQPVVTLEANPAADRRTAALAIHVCQAPPDTKHSQGSGARDLRLFRNGILVRRWHGDLLQGKACRDLAAEVGLTAGMNTLVAYAFNDGDIKSEDTTAPVEGGEKSAGAEGTGYILAVGVDKYAPPGMDLRYARDDAQAFATEFAQDQAALRNFKTMVPVSLLDDDATAANIRAALAILAGDPVPLSEAQRRLFAGLRKAQPEDGVFLFFAGHGTAVHNQFYLLPHDFAPGAMAEDPEQAHAISDGDLGRLFEGIDGRHFLVIIDACRSGQALEAEEKRQGAMNSKGLAQLAYEKGMYILTASQAYQAAMEASQYGHGLLTYSLLDLISHPASTGGELYLLDWLEEAAEQVPALQRNFLEGSRGFSLVEGQESLAPAQRSVQRPRLFYRRDPDPNPLLVVAPPAQPK